MYKLVRRRMPDRYDWSEALQTLKRMKPGKNVAFFVQKKVGDNLSKMADSLEKAAEVAGLPVVIRQDLGEWRADTPKGIWVWRL